ncbi:histidine phosphatase superfamily [Flagelloscypha sp. PMI_526]|nr:histidine phosphatase superfamily [Flagelloscypha sp. PMI_526]
MKLANVVSNVVGVMVIARNGDRMNYYQDPNNYAASYTETTALGEVQAHMVGKVLRETYLEPTSPNAIRGMSGDLIDNQKVKVHVKVGNEGTVVFDSAIALLQGLFPPTPRNKISLANGTDVVAPLGGYQYIPVETVEPLNDRSLESWTDCPAFQRHISEFYNSPGFSTHAGHAKTFLDTISHFIFGRPAVLQNMWNIFDYVHSELTHNRTYAYRLPPTFDQQARHWVNYHEGGVFSDSKIDGIGNIAGRTLLAKILSSMERISFNGDPLQLMLVETTYQPFISLFNLTGASKYDPELQTLPNYASALAIELRRSDPPEVRDFLRFRFKNGTENGFRDVHVFDHQGDIPLTEFIYRSQGAAVKDNGEWYNACNARVSSSSSFSAATMKFFENQQFINIFAALIFIVGFFMILKTVIKNRKQNRWEGYRNCEVNNLHRKQRNTF